MNLPRTIVQHFELFELEHFELFELFELFEHTTFLRKSGMSADWDLACWGAVWCARHSRNWSRSSVCAATRLFCSRSNSARTCLSCRSDMWVRTGLNSVITLFVQLKVYVFAQFREILKISDFVCNNDNQALFK